MRLIYFILLGVLWWCYGKTMSRLRGEGFPLTPILGWMTGLGYFLLAPLTLLVLHGGYTIPDFYQANPSFASVDLSNDTYVIPVLVVSAAFLLTCATIIGLTSSRDSRRAPLSLSLNDRRLRSVILLTLGLSVLDYAFTIHLLGGLQPFLVSHWYYREENLAARFGSLYVAYTHLSLANQAVYTGAAALYTASMLQRKRWSWWAASIIALGLSLFLVMTGNRIFIALYGLSFLVSCWFYQRRRLLLALLGVAPVVLVFFSAWGYFRHNLATIPKDVPTYLGAQLGNRAMDTLMTTTEGPSVMQLLHMVNDFGHKFDYLYGLTYTKAITFIIPRSLYPDKPNNYPALIANLYEPGGETSLGTTQLGELYANFGVLSVLLLPLTAALVFLFSRSLARNPRNHALLLAVSFLLFTWYARSSFEDNFITFLFTLSLIRGLRLERGLCCRSRPELASRLVTS